jgi:hypothetical protein
MSDLLSAVAELRRPRMLIRAAHHGLDDYSRTRDLGRVMRSATLPTPGRAVAQLLDEEGRVEEHRKSGDASYSIARHIDLLVAMIAEARLMSQGGQGGSGPVVPLG